MARRNRVPESVSAETPRARKAEERRRREIMAENSRTSLLSREPKPYEHMTREQYRELMSRGGQGDPDEMLGKRMNPLLTAPMFAGGAPASIFAALKLAGFTAATMKGLEMVSETRPRTAAMIQLGLAAAALPGLATAGRRSIMKAVNDALSEPTDAKLNLLYEMVRATSEDKSLPKGAQRARLNEGLQKLLTTEATPKQLAGPGQPAMIDWQGPKALLTMNKEAQRGPAAPQKTPPAARQAPAPAPAARQKTPPVAPQKTSPVARQAPAPAPAAHQGYDPGATPIRETRWYADLVSRYGSDRAERIANFAEHPNFLDYFAPDPDSLDQMMRYAGARKIIRDVTEPNEIVVGGSAGINLDGTIVRDTAVPHDLDFSGYIANASRRTDIPFYLNDGRPLSPQVRQEMFAALSNHANIEGAPLIQKLRSLYPELRDAKFRYANYDWEFSQGAQYKPGVFTVVKQPDITDAGNGTVLVTTVVDGNNVDLMLTDAKIQPSSVDSRYGSAATAFDWKRYYGYRPKDVKDWTGYAEFSQDNPVASAVSGRARFSPSRFADSLITEEGLPTVVDIEQYPGGPKIPMVMNHRGIMLQADDPSTLSIYAKDNPINLPQNQAPATVHDKPLVAARVAQRIIRANGAPGEAAPSIGVYRADDPERLANHLIQWANGQDDVVVYRNGSTVDPQSNLANVLYTENAETGLIADPSWWPGKPGRTLERGERIRLVEQALRNPTPENLQALGQAFGESTRGSTRHAPMVDRIDNRLRNVLYNRYPYEYAEAKPGRYVPDTEAQVFHGADQYKGLVEALKDARFVIPFLTAAGLYEASDAEETQQDAKGGNTRTDAKGGDTGPAEDESIPEPGADRSSVSSPSPAGGGPRIVINPSTFRNEKDALCVAFNEAFRLVMEEMGFNPVAEPTEAQRRFFSDTAYRNDELQLRRTILARICTFDTSVKDPTDEQLQEAVEFLTSVLEAGAPQNDWEQKAVMRLRDVIARVSDRGRRTGTPTGPSPAPGTTPAGS